MRPPRVWQGEYLVLVLNKDKSKPLSFRFGCLMKPKDSVSQIRLGSRHVDCAILKRARDGGGTVKSAHFFKKFLLE